MFKVAILFYQHISHLFQRARFNNLFTESIAAFNIKNPEEKTTSIILL